MKLINRDTDYAVKALMHIAKNSERISVSELATKLDIPKPFLRKILQILNKENILNSHKGKGGGFKLAKPSKDIYLKDLIKIFQGPIKLKDCIFNQKICPDIKTCPLREKIRDIEKYVLSEIESVTLATLIEKGSALQDSSVS